ncbi:MAG: RNA methyltransferase [bacterium]|nr:RNA methyltransferase [bacterium]
MKYIYLILDDIRSMENVGSIFRTADAAGVKKIYLCGITPRPPRKEIDKAALGAVDFVEWEYAENVKTLISNFKKAGINVVALEQDTRSINYRHFSPKSLNSPTALIVGNEVAGISPEVLDLCDAIVEIPMHGQKNSLNVAVATGIILYKIIE